METNPAIYGKIKLNLFIFELALKAGIMRYLSISVFFCVLMMGNAYAQDAKHHGPKHIVKINLAPIFIGEIMSSYEYIINNKISMEAGIGFMTENYLQQFIEQTNAGQTRQIKFGPSFFIAARYYPYKKGEIIYCTGEIRYRNYKEVYQETGSSGGITEIDEYQQKVIPRMGIGYHLYLDDHFLIDFSTYLGLTFDKRLQFGYTDPINKTGIHFGIGIKFAYAF